MITSIAERAEVSRPTLYRYFSDRSAIYDSLIRAEVEQAVDEIATRAASTRAPREEYIDVVVTLTLQARNHPALQAVLAKHPEIMASHLPRILPIVLDIAEPRLTPALDAGTREGRWPAIDAHVAISWTARLIAALIVMPLPEDGDEAGLRATVSALLDVANSIAPSQ